MTGAKRLVVGSELSTLDGDLYCWRPLIEKVRAVFGGRLVYSANWDHYKNAALFDLCDEEGISGRTPASFRDAKAPDDDATAEAGWRRMRANSLAGWTPGPLHLHGAWLPLARRRLLTPWNESPGGKPDPDEQRRGFAAFRRAWTGSAILDGVYIWNWYGYGGPATTSYTPRGKPAEAEVRALLVSLRHARVDGSAARRVLAWTERGPGSRASLRAVDFRRAESFAAAPGLPELRTY